ncbi:MAG: SDR family oxidoreductase [Gaiellales bacterium]
MRVVIAGGHGKVALRLTQLLADRGDEPIGLIRSEEQGADIEARGGAWEVVDLESAAVGELADLMEGADAVVFAAGAGPGSGAERKLTVDRNAALLLIDAAKAAGVGRYVMLSAAQVDHYDPDSADVMQVYLRAKSEADAELRASGLDWTIVRPGSLTNDTATGHVQIGVGEHDSVSRADVAAVIAACLHDPASIGHQFEFAAGEVPIEDAIRAPSRA